MTSSPYRCCRPAPRRSRSRRRRPARRLRRHHRSRAGTDPVGVRAAPATSPVAASHEGRMAATATTAKTAKTANVYAGKVRAYGDSVMLGASYALKSGCTPRCSPTSPGSPGTCCPSCARIDAGQDPRAGRDPHRDERHREPSDLIRTVQKVQKNTSWSWSTSSCRADRGPGTTRTMRSWPLSTGVHEWCWWTGRRRTSRHRAGCTATASTSRPRAAPPMPARGQEAGALDRPLMDRRRRCADDGS